MSLVRKKSYYYFDYVVTNYYYLHLHSFFISHSLTLGIDQCPESIEYGRNNQDFPGNLSVCSQCYLQCNPVKHLKFSCVDTKRDWRQSPNVVYIHLDTWAWDVNWGNPLYTYLDSIDADVASVCGQSYLHFVGCLDYLAERQYTGLFLPSASNHIVFRDAVVENEKPASHGI